MNNEQNNNNMQGYSVNPGNPDLGNNSSPVLTLQGLLWKGHMKR